MTTAEEQKRWEKDFYEKHGWMYSNNREKQCDFRIMELLAELIDAIKKERA